MMPRSPPRPFLAAYFSLAAVIGCGARVTGGTTGATGTGGGDAGGMDSGSGVSCHRCACVNGTSMGGCADYCSGGENPPPFVPFFCDGQTGLVPCAECLMMNCPTADPNDPSTCM